MAKTPELDLRENYGKNYVINGDMRIAQRGTSFAAIANNTYTLDRWVYGKVGAAVHTVSQDTDVPTFAQSGYLFQNSLRINLTTPDNSIDAGDLYYIGQRIEGYNFANIAQKPFTVSFWVKANTIGKYYVSAVNNAADRSAVRGFTINSSNTWEQKTVDFPASPSAGSWNYTTGSGLRLTFVLAAGTSFHTTENAWQVGNFFSASDQVNGVNTGSTDFRITGVMLNEGTQALPFRTFSGSFEGELAACQRYYEKSSDLSTAVGSGISTGLNPGLVGVGFSSNSVNGFQRVAYISYKQRKRTAGAPACFSTTGVLNQSTQGDGATQNIAGSATPNQPGDYGFNVTSSNAYTTSFYSVFFNWSCDAEL